MNDNERAIVAAMAQLRKLQRDALAIQAKIHRLEQEEVEVDVYTVKDDLVSLKHGLIFHAVVHDFDCFSHNHISLLECVKMSNGLNEGRLTFQPYRPPQSLSGTL